MCQYRLTTSLCCALRRKTLFRETRVVEPCVGGAWMAMAGYRGANIPSSALLNLGDVQLQQAVKPCYKLLSVHNQYAAFSLPPSSPSTQRPRSDLPRFSHLRLFVNTTSVSYPLVNDMMY